MKQYSFIFTAIINLFFYYKMEGTVKFFIESKGFGFITNDETGKDIFVHATGLEGIKLFEGDKVEYEEEEGKKGMMAVRVRVIKD